MRLCSRCMGRELLRTEETEGMAGKVFFHLWALYGGITGYVGLRMFISEEEKGVFLVSIYISNSTQKLWMTLIGLHA